ncbi:MAG: DUF2905 domain-containing protein [Desulfatibacillaceae bacterium]
MEPWQEMGKWLVALGVVLAIAGVAVMFWDKLPLSRIPLGRLPGDIVIKRPGFTIYFPLATMILISAVVSLVLYLLRR